MSAKSMEDIAAELKSLRFKKTLFGGVSEADVWRQLEKLHAAYQSVLDAQAARYEAILAERSGSRAAGMARQPDPAAPARG